MPFPSAISDYTPLRGSASITPSYAANQYLCLCPNTVIFKALVNGAPTGTSFAQVTFDTVTTGAYTDIEDGMTVLIGTNANIRNATFVGRVRKTPTSTVLYINETSVAIANNDNIWVINDYRVWDKLARLSGGVQYKDYDLTFSQLKPVISGLQSAYAGICSGSPSGFTVAFSASALAAASGATISSYAWTIPSGGTVTAGATNAANVTVRFDAGFYWVKLVVTDSGSRTATRRIPVWSIPADFSSVITLGFEGATIEGQEGSWTVSVNAFTGVDTLLDNTLACIVETEYYNGIETAILSAVKFIGRLRTESGQTSSDATYSQLQKAGYELEGVGAQLSREEHLPFTLITKSSPTIWDEIKTLTIWRAIVYTLQEHTTFLNLHDLTFDSTADTFAYPALPTQGGNILSVISDLAVSINAVFQSAPSGECQVVREAVYLTTAQRAALTTIADFTTADLISFTVDREEIDTTGKIDASGGFYTSSSGKVTPLLSLAPGMAQGIGETIGSLTRQVLQANVAQSTAQSELNTRSGHHYEKLRRKAPELNVTLPPGYNWLVPSVNQWYTWTIASTDNTGGRAFTTSDRWLCTSVSITHDNVSGSKDVQANFRLETAGQSGQTVTYPPPASIAVNLTPVPVIPPYPSLPPLPSIYLPPTPTDSDAPPYTPPSPPSNGNIAVVWSASQVWLSSDLMLTSTPTYREITPQSGLSYTSAAWVGNGARGLYVLANDGTDSTFFYSADPFASPPTWVSTSLTGVIYTLIRVSSTTGAVYVVGYTITATDISTWDLYDASHGTIIARDATSITVQATETVPNQFYVILTGSSAADCARVNSIDLISGATGGYLTSWLPCGDLDYAHLVSGILGSTCIDLYQTQNADAFTIKVNFGQALDCGGSITGTKVAYSTNFGASFAAAQSVTSALGSEQGFDIERIGVPTLVGSTGQTQIATSAGGAYSNYGSAFADGDFAANLYKIPRFQFNSTSASNAGTTTPDYVVACETPTPANHSIYRVTSSGTTFSDLTPVNTGVYGGIAGPDGLDMPFKSGARIAAVFDFNGTRRLYVSTNAGTAWTNRGTIDAAARMVRYRRGDRTLSQLFIADGTSGILVSNDHGVTLLSRTVPTADDILGIEPF